MFKSLQMPIRKKSGNLLNAPRMYLTVTGTTTPGQNGLRVKSNAVVLNAPEAQDHLNQMHPIFGGDTVTTF